MTDSCRDRVTEVVTEDRQRSKRAPFTIGNVCCKPPGYAITLDIQQAEISSTSEAGTRAIESAVLHCQLAGHDFCNPTSAGLHRRIFGHQPHHFAGERNAKQDCQSLESCLQLSLEKARLVHEFPSCTYST